MGVHAVSKKLINYTPQWEKPFDPVWVKDPYAMTRGPWIGKWLLVGFTFEGFRAVGRQVHETGSMMGVTHAVIPARNLHNYSIIDDENSPLQVVISGLKGEMLEHGATPLAVQWIGELSPFTEQEYNTMADKLTKPVGKGGALKAEKPAKDDAADATPKAAKPKKAGNPAALEKAREKATAARGERDKLKITVNTDKKANPYREGSKAHATFELFKQHKTVGDVRAAATDAHDLGYINYASRDGHISLG